jgi:hypothetical protein
LAAEERTTLRAQPAAPSTRMFAFTTGTLGLLAIGMLIFIVTPRRQESPIAISATTTPISSVTALTAAPSSTPGQPGSNRPVALAPAFAARGPLTAVSPQPQHALATPIGDGHLALITGVALASLGTNSLDDPAIDVQLPSGRVGSGTIVEQSGDTWLIELSQPEAGHGIANSRPIGAEIVTVMDSPPVTIAFADVATLDVPEGAAVLDHAGDLVGLCTRRRGDGQVSVIEIRAEHVAATSDAP